MRRVITKAEAKRTADIIKLVNTVYKEHVFISNASEPMNYMAEPLEYESTNKIFQRSYFVNIVPRVFPELEESIISMNDIYQALKMKLEAIDVVDNTIYLIDNEGHTYPVGIKITPDKYDQISVKSTMERMQPYYDALNSNEWTFSSVTCGRDVVDRLIDYQTVTIRDEEHDGVAVILTAKCFPNIKKCDAMQIDWLSKPDDERFYTMITSSFMDGILFRMLVETLKC